MRGHFNYNRFAFFCKAFAGWVRNRALIRLVLLSGVLAFTLIAGDVIFEYPLKKIAISPRLDGGYFLTSDNLRLPVRAWLPAHQPVKAVIVALHGINDYSNFFTAPANYLKQKGIASYAYDQRGFGLAPDRGNWAKIGEFTRDLGEFTRLVRSRHPGAPVYLLGESMGAAIIIVAMTGNAPPPADGVILSAPAVWGWQSVPWYQRIGLWLASRAVPELRLTGSSLHLVPTDNVNMLRELVRDPLILKETRLETIYGLAELMNQAFEKAKHLDKMTLVLYGERDEIVPKRSVYLMLNSLPPDRKWRVALYENGYHLLLRDLEAPRYWRDIAAWIEDPERRLPSGADKRAVEYFMGAGF